MLQQVATGDGIKVNYRGATMKQLLAVMARSSYCTMEFSYECYQSSLHSNILASQLPVVIGFVNCIARLHQLAYPHIK